MSDIGALRRVRPPADPAPGGDRLPDGADDREDVTLLELFDIGKSSG